MRNPRPRTRRSKSASRSLPYIKISSLLLLTATSTSAQEVVKRQTTQSVPLKITNNCPETIWPAIASQSGTGPNTGGFELSPGSSQTLLVGSDWQGRVWGRTNCSFNSAGSGASNLNGNNGAGRACMTGDCNGVLSCVVTGDTPVTLAEFDLQGGTNGQQTFYDISLVDGYNLPIGLTYIPGNSSNLQEIPPNLTNAACIATTGLISTAANPSTNASFPIPYDTTTTNTDLERWCPWDLQLSPPTKPGDGVYPYPDDNIQRPAFDPCLSACAESNSPSDCCTGSYNSPQSCKPSLYSTQAKSVCPDAYSYAFDDTTSTFIIPSGGGWEVTFCPLGRSTNILKTFGQELRELASTGKVSPSMLADSQNVTKIEMGSGARHAFGEPPLTMTLGKNGRVGTLVVGTKGDKVGGSLLALVVVLAWACFW